MIFEAMFASVGIEPVTCMDEDASSFLAGAWCHLLSLATCDLVESEANLHSLELGNGSKHTCAASNTPAPSAAAASIPKATASTPKAANAAHFGNCRGCRHATTPSFATPFGTVVSQPSCTGPAAAECWGARLESVHKSNPAGPHLCVNKIVEWIYTINVP